MIFPFIALPEEKCGQATCSNGEAITLFRN